MIKYRKLKNLLIWKCKQKKVAQLPTATRMAELEGECKHSYLPIFLFTFVFNLRLPVFIQFVDVYWTQGKHRFVEFSSEIAAEEWQVLSVGLGLLCATGEIKSIFRSDGSLLIDLGVSRIFDDRFPVSRTILDNFTSFWRCPTSWFVLVT